MHRSSIFLAFGATIAGLLAYGGNRIINADDLQWELYSRPPTNSIEYSKRLGVFECELTANPDKFELDGSHFEIGSVWVEHRANPERINMFTTKVRIHSELYLVVRIKLVARNPRIVPPAIEIVNSASTNVSGLYVEGRNELVSEIGASVPKACVIRDALDGSIRVSLSRKPNQSTDPTP
jgi:predicted RNase H-like HicB family nuclease